MDELDRILRRDTLAARLNEETIRRGLRVIDELIDAEMEDRGNLGDFRFLNRVKTEMTQVLRAGYSAAKISVLVPAGLLGIGIGNDFPDLDITLLGIGKHRFFLFHSALGLVVLRYLFKLWVENSKEQPATWFSRVRQKLAGAALGSFAVGVGLHLAIDAFQPKAVIFPFFGSLVDGTLVDDRLWLLGNSLWCFKVANDIYSLVLADELAVARRYAQGVLGDVQRAFFVKGKGEPGDVIHGRS